MLIWKKIVVVDDNYTIQMTLYFVTKNIISTL